MRIGTVADSGALSDRNMHKRYPGYFDTGFAWLGSIPAHWEVVRTKRVATLKTGHTPSRQVPEYWVDVDCDIPWFTLADVWQLREGRQKYLGETSEKISALGLRNSAAELLPSGTVILSRTASVGFSGIMPIPMATTQDFVNWICGPRILPDYLLWVFRAMNPEFERLVQGSTHKTIYMPDAHRFVTPLPRLDEQRAIAAFLDRETARIDELIVKKQRLIELLKEKRTSMISRFVWQGINESGQQKDSGVPWIGMIPKHWDVLPLRGVLHQRGEYNVGPKTTNILSVVKDVGVINYDERAASGNKKSENIEQYKIIRPGDIVLNRMNIIIGSVGVAKQYGASSIEYYVLRPRDESVNNEYYGLMFSTRPFQLALVGIGSGILAHRMRISFLDFKKLPLPKPPRKEQDQIVEHVRDKLSAMEALEKKSQLAIDKVNTYRSALITAAVTGQIDVRNCRREAQCL